MRPVTVIATAERRDVPAAHRGLRRRTYQNTVLNRSGGPHKLIRGVVLKADMTASLASLAAAASSLPLQSGLFASQAGQLLVTLLAVAIVIVVGKFVLKLAWRLVTIGIVLVAAFFLLSTLGLI